MADQKKFATDEGFPYPLLSDPEKTMGAAYDACRQEGEKYFEAGIPRRISYLISPDGKIAKACLLYTSPSPRDKRQSRMPSSA